MNQSMISVLPGYLAIWSTRCINLLVLPYAQVATDPGAGVQYGQHLHEAQVLGAYQLLGVRSGERDLCPEIRS